MNLETRASVHVPRPPEVVFDYATAPANLPRMMRAYGPIPAIERAEMLSEDLRRVHMSDGSAIEEKLLALVRPRQHLYRWASGLRPPLSLLVRWGEAEWTFRPDGAGTEVTWVYRFELRSLLAYPVALVVVRLFNTWMSRGLSELRRQVG